ncbi:flavin reductase like domain-containing protein [Exophiala viscosa]|uniref:flavin reductase like domain-containing protein n=1 Tax=Exophiala viscosa TaxID=2486360 RepID=UPI00219A905E|nr:flavin reductase like domain-containing protein [Exophiala viscosa]
MLSGVSFGRFAKTACTAPRLNKTSFSPQEFQQLCRGKLGCHGYENPVAAQGCVARRLSTYSPSLDSQPQVSTTETVADKTTESQDEHPSRPSNTMQSRQLIADKVRRVMRKIPHPVAIITATDTTASPSGGPEAWRGATVSSLNTVTLSPYPVISFNINKISSTLDAIYATGHFNVHFLSSSPQGKMIASKFARGNASSPFYDEHGELEPFVRQLEAGPAPSPVSPPIIRPRFPGKPVAVPLRLHCTLMQSKVVEIGDHLVVFGRVIRTFYQNDHFDRDTAGETPILVYANGDYNRCERYKKFKHINVPKHVEKQSDAEGNAPVDEDGGVKP